MNKNGRLNNWIWMRHWYKRIFCCLATRYFLYLFHRDLNRGLLSTDKGKKKETWLKEDLENEANTPRMWIRDLFSANRVRCPERPLFHLPIYPPHTRFSPLCISRVSPSSADHCPLSHSSLAICAYIHLASQSTYAETRRGVPFVCANNAFAIVTYATQAEN